MPKVLIGFAVLLCLALPASAEQSELAAPTELSPFITPVKPPPVNLTEPGPANGE